MELPSLIFVRLWTFSWSSTLEQIFVRLLTRLFACGFPEFICMTEQIIPFIKYCFSISLSLLLSCIVLVDADCIEEQTNRLFVGYTI